MTSQNDGYIMYFYDSGGARLWESTEGRNTWMLWHGGENLQDTWRTPMNDEDLKVQFIRVD